MLDDQRHARVSLFDRDPAGGQEISGKDDIKNWVQEFLDRVNDLHVDAIETFQTEDRTAPASRPDGC